MSWKSREDVAADILADLHETLLQRAAGDDPELARKLAKDVVTLRVVGLIRMGQSGVTASFVCRRLARDFSNDEVRASIAVALLDGYIGSEQTSASGETEPWLVFLRDL